MSYGSFGFAGDPIPGHWHATGPPRGYRRRYRSRSRRHRSDGNPPPDTTGTQMMSSPAPAPALSETARELLASPPVRNAIAGAIAGFIRGGPAGALSGGAAGALGGALPPSPPMLALPPPRGE